MDRPPPNLRVLDTAPFREALDLVNEVFHRVNRVLPENQRLQTVTPDTTARQAIRIMIDSGFSQLPIMTKSGEVLGVFSYRSFAARAAMETLESIKTDKCSPGDLQVDEYAEEYQFARVSEELQSVFPSMDADNGILIGSPSNLQGVLTPMDFLKYLYEVASPFVLLSEIELSLRSLISAAVTDEQLTECVENSLKRLYEGKAPPSHLSEMTFDNYRTLIDHSKNWEWFRPIFGGMRTRTAAKLKQVRDLRNDVFHFKRELTDEDRQNLQGLRDWILIKAKSAESRNKGGQQ